MKPSPIKSLQTEIDFLKSENLKLLKKQEELYKDRADGFLRIGELNVRIAELDKANEDKKYDYKQFLATQKESGAMKKRMNALIVSNYELLKTLDDDGILI